MIDGYTLTPGEIPTDNELAPREIDFFERTYLGKKAIEEQKVLLANLINGLKKKEYKIELETYLCEHGLEDSEKILSDEIQWRLKVFKILKDAKMGRAEIDENGLKELCLSSVKTLQYVISLAVDNSISLEDLATKGLPNNVIMTDRGSVNTLKDIYLNSNTSQFYDEDLGVTDKNGNSVNPDSEAIQKSKYENARGETNAAFITKQTLRAFFPALEGGVQLMRNTVGLDLYGFISKGEFLTSQDKKDVMSFNNFDQNMWLNLLPNVLMTVAHRTDNNIFKLSASATPLILQLIANMKERNHPLHFSKNDQEINWTQFGALFIPIVVESLRILFPKESLQGAIRSGEVPLLNSANDLFRGVTNQNNNTPNQYAGVRREIKQPRYGF